MATITIGEGWPKVELMTPTGGFEVTGNISLATYDLLAVDSIYGSTSILPVRIGDAATTSHSLASEDDLMVTGKLEVDGYAYFDDYLYGTRLFASSHIAMTIDGTDFSLGVETDFILRWDTSDANANEILFVSYVAGGSNVQTFVFGGSSIYSVDLGLFDGVTQPTIAVVEKGAKYTSSSLATAAGAQATMTTVAAVFAASVVGDIIRVVSGANATAGWYWITTVTDSYNVILDRNWCTGAVTVGVMLAYHDFTMLSADGICTRITDGAPTDASVEIDRDGWIILDVGNNLLYGRSQSIWQHWTPDGGSPQFATIDATGAYQVDAVQVVSNRVIDARCDDVVDATYGAEEAGVLDALRDAMIAHGLIAAA